MLLSPLQAARFSDEAARFDAQNIRQMMTSNYARRCCLLWHLFRYQILLQTLNLWLQPSLMMNYHSSATSNQLGSDRQSAADDFPLCSHTTCGMYLTELELGLQGQLMPLNHPTIHSTHCCPIHTLLFGSSLNHWKHSRTTPDHGC